LKRISIEARSRESAEGFVTALDGFRRELVSNGEGYRVEIVIATSAEVGPILRALHGHLTASGCASTPVDLDGRRYMFHAY
jgi:hypothetical protein